MTQLRELEQSANRKPPKEHDVGEGLRSDPHGNRETQTRDKCCPLGLHSQVVNRPRASRVAGFGRAPRPILRQTSFGCALGFRRDQKLGELEPEDTHLESSVYCG